jgi:hypothetical protein
MTIRNGLIGSLMVVTILVAGVLAEHVSSDYDHSTHFGNYRRYSWSKVETANSMWDSRVKNAIDQ